MSRTTKFPSWMFSDYNFNFEPNYATLVVYSLQRMMLSDLWDSHNSGYASACSNKNGDNYLLCCINNSAPMNKSL